MGPTLLGLLALLVVSAFLSGSEVALFALNRVQLRRLQKSADRGDRRVAELLARPTDLLSTILVGNTLVNVSTAALVTTTLLHALRDHPDLAAALAIAVDFAVILAFGEVLPKVVAIRRPYACARVASLPLIVLRAALRPLVLVLSACAVVLLRILGLRPTLRPGGSVSDTDLRSLLDTLGEEGDLLEEERTIARRIFEFSSGRAAEVMTPRLDIRAVERHVSIESLGEIIRSSQHTRLPVYDGDLDEIVGFLNAKQMLLTPGADLDALLNPTLFVPENKRVSDLFHDMQRQAIGMAVVVDEYGHTAGIITKEDLIEEIVGEIYDEYEVGLEPIAQLGPERYMIDGTLPVGDLSEELAIELDTDAVTVNGMLAEVLGRIPRQHDLVEIAGWTFRVGEVRRHRVVRCEVRRGGEPSAPSAERDAEAER